MQSPPPASATPWIPGSAVRIDAGPYVLRSLTKDDATDRFCGWLADPVVQANLNAPPTPSTRQALALHIEAFDNARAFLLGIFDRASDLHLGMYSIYCDLANGNGETIVMVGDRAWWGRGVVRDTRPAVVDFLFEDVGLEKVWSRPLARDFAGVHGFLAMGYRCEGVLRGQLRSPTGQRADQLFFGLMRADWRARRAAAA